MSQSNNYLSSGGNQGDPYLKDYRHASRFYVDNNQSRAPKYGFLYYVNFIINQDVAIDRVDKNLGMYVKKIDLPKFSIKTEMVNQYNRKTQIHTGITYSPISIDFHDDNDDVTNELWSSYYKNLIADGNYNQDQREIPEQFTDTKYGTKDFEYGIYNRGKRENFFQRIDIYLLHHTHQEHTLISLINPKITEWRHDSANQSESSKVLQNTMNIVYENVLYFGGSHKENIERVPGYKNEFYDNESSPLKIGGNQKNSTTVTNGAPQRPGNAAIFDRNQAPVSTGNPLFDKAGRARAYNIPARQQSLFDLPGRPRQYGVVNSPNNIQNPLLDIAAILAKGYVNQNGLGRVGPKGYNIASSVVNSAVQSPAGKYYDPPSNQYVPGLFNLPGGIGVNIFKGFNTGVDGKIRVNPAAIVLPPKR